MELVKIDVYGAKLAGTFKDDTQIVTRVKVVLEALVANSVIDKDGNRTKVKGAPSQNKVLGALADAIGASVAAHVTGWKAGNLAHYARVGMALQSLGLALTAPAIVALYGVKLRGAKVNDEGAFERIITEALALPQDAREAHILAETAKVFDAIRANAAAEREEAEKNKGKAEQKSEEAEAGEDAESITLEDLTSTLSAQQVADLITQQVARDWSPEDARTILASLNAAVDRVTSLTGLKPAAAALL